MSIDHQDPLRANSILLCAQYEDTVGPAEQVDIKCDVPLRGRYVYAKTIDRCMYTM